MVAISGSAPDFSAAASSAGSPAVTPDQTATYIFSVTPSAGFTQAVMFSCGGAPALSTPTVMPSWVTLNGSASRP
jgi:hypothetical protein